MRKMFCLGLAALSMGIAVPGTMAAEKAAISLPQKMAGGETVEVYYRKGLPVSAARARLIGWRRAMSSSIPTAVGHTIRRPT